MRVVLWILGLVEVTTFILSFATSFVNARARIPASSVCKHNLKNVATALEVYAEENNGQFPIEVPGGLVPNYLRSLPTCPSAGRITYADGYLCSDGGVVRQLEFPTATIKTTVA